MPKTDHYALVVGINDYTPVAEGGLKTLGGAINDANSFEAWLLNPQGGDLHPANCLKITSTTNPLLPIKDQIDDALETIYRAVRGNGGSAIRFYFYFAGHGVGVEQDIKDTALCLAKWSSMRRNLAVSVEKYRNLILLSGIFRQVVFFADCCRSYLYNVKPEDSVLAFPATGPYVGSVGSFVGYATQYQDQSYETENEQSEMRGIFTRVLLDGLSGSAVNPNGEVDADYLRDYLVIQTPILAHQNGYKQIPEAIHSFSAANPCLFYKVDVTIAATINLTEVRTGIVILYNGDDEETAQLDPNVTRTFIQQLRKGYYKLVDSVTGQEAYFSVSRNNNNNNVSF